MKRLLLTFGVLLSLSFTSWNAQADEGMWLFNRLPLEHLSDQYGFEPDQAWADHLMRASVRLNSGGSGSFVSSEGLVLTNHHVGSDALHDLSDDQNNYLRDGFLAKSWKEELRAPNMELNQLISIEDVTERVNASVGDDMSAADAAATRRAAIADIEKEAMDRTGNRCNVVTLYGGGRYHLYEYKKYTDVRLVWAPESAAAFFGGDADNFEYPRYCLDACLFRVYEDGQPAKIEHFLKWNDGGAKEGDLVFVSGNPGRTSRIYTYSALQYERDARIPSRLNSIRRREVLLQQYSLRGEAQKQQAENQLFGVQNGRKAYMGMLAGLQNPAFLTKKKEAEEALLAEIRSRPELADYAKAWEQIDEVMKRRAEKEAQSFSLNTRIYNIAQTLVRLAIEQEKDNAERLPAYRDSNLESLKQQLLSRAPIYLELEQFVLADLISSNLESLGADHELCQTVLAGQSPQARAAELVSQTRVADLAYREELLAGGMAAIQASEDPMIQLALALDEADRASMKEDDALAEMQRQAYGKIAEALFALQGTSVYPDATFTLRLAYGVVKGYDENGTTIPAYTTMGGAFEHEERHGKTDPWELPASWHAARDEIQADTPYNFVCTADIIGGNSGSPVVNQDLELVGLIFDGNIQSLTANFFFSDEQSRATSVHAGAIREALRKVYGASELADQLGK